MYPRRVLAVLAIAFLVSWIVRLNNALTFPALRAFDGFGHFTYIWFMAENWRVPEPTSGWSFFHPPVYYWLMASIWTLFDSIDPVARLRIGTCLTATLGLTQAVVILAILRRYLPGRYVLHVLSAGLMLFLPVHLYTAGYLGNESFNAVMCTVTLFIALWVLRAPSWRRGMVLGLMLGASMLTKFTAVAFVVGSFGALALHTVVRRDWKNGVATLVAAGVVMTSVCGWFFARNILEYGDPFKVSRDEFCVRRHENLQTCGKRDLLEYVLFDPLIILRPQWPRGIPLVGELPPGVEHSSLRESVWTGLFANAFFDAVGNQILPAVTVSEESRRSGQILLGLGFLPTVLVVVGILTAIGRLWRKGWDPTLVLMLLTFFCMLATFVQATRTVPMNAAVKATYMTPAAVIFAFWFALGADRLTANRPKLLRGLAVWCAALFVASAVVFANGVFVARGWLAESTTNSPVWKNLYGIVYYAGGWRDKARDLFEAGAVVNWHLSHENLAALALEDGKLLEALYEIRRAIQMQPGQAFGNAADKAEYERITQAEYRNTLAVIYHRLGWTDLALAAAKDAARLDPSIPEVNYDLAVLTLETGISRGGRKNHAEMKASIDESRRLLFNAIVGDPNFVEARALMATLPILEGDCERGIRERREALRPREDQHRFYPVTTGIGDIMAAAVKRRVHIEELPALLRPDNVPEWCRQAAGEG